MTSTCFICVTCGTQFGPSQSEPDRCPICEDERQYIGHGGQIWTTLEALRRVHRNEIVEEGPGVFSVLPIPKLAIGQRAFLVRTGACNVLWDCVPLIDEATVARIAALGGVSAIAVSHPHYYSTMVEWSRAFGGAPIYLHREEARWVMRPDPCIRFWDGERHAVLGDLALVRTGGHFDGYQVLHWPNGADGRGVLFSGDQPMVAQDRRWVSFMYSYPNLIPLGPRAIRRIADALADLAFDRIYGAFPGQVVATDGSAAVARSAARYLNAISGSHA
jgi:glyoxylase-like metal-dependent hydrolase (beta-lactamase superfamily II)